MTTYNFAAQLADGQAGETFLDGFFAELGYVVEPVSEELQLRGIDRLMTGSNGPVYVEYKTDYHNTGRAFVETQSTEKRLGWAFTSQAEILVYFLPVLAVVYVMRLTAMRNHLNHWLKAYPSADVPNEGWVTRGVIVPLTEFDAIALRKYSITLGK
jgi:hypothetical protein